MSNTPALLSELAAILDPAGLQTGDAIDTRFRKDWYAPLGNPPLAVVRPRTTADVAAILAACHRHGQPVVPQGGLTGLASAATPGQGEVVLSLERMRGVEEIDEQAGTMTVWAGTTLQAAQEAAHGRMVAGGGSRRTRQLSDRRQYRHQCGRQSRDSVRHDARPGTRD
jgi:FAD/FMN-containing dehydrogenase